MTSLDEVLTVLGMNASKDNPITVKQMSEIINKVTIEEDCVNKINSFLNKFPYLFKRIKSTEPRISGKKPYKYWLSEKGVKYFNQRTGLGLVENIKEL